MNEKTGKTGYTGEGRTETGIPEACAALDLFLNAFPRKRREGTEKEKRK